jgi:hypothetical protein
LWRTISLAQTAGCWPVSATAYAYGMEARGELHKHKSSSSNLRSGSAAPARGRSRCGREQVNPFLAGCLRRIWWNSICRTDRVDRPAIAPASPPQDSDTAPPQWWQPARQDNPGVVLEYSVNREQPPGDHCHGLLSGQFVQARQPPPAECCPRYRWGLSQAGRAGAATARGEIFLLCTWRGAG